MKWIATAVIAALLMTGGAFAAPELSEPARLQPGSSQQTQSTQNKTLLTAQDAEDIALAHAAVTDVTGLGSEPDLDDRTPHWEVEFRAGDWEYDYEIDACTGEVLHQEKEYDPNPRPITPAPVDPVPTEPAPAEPVMLTAQAAKDIALRHAGVTAFRDLEAEPDRERGRLVWEVDFEAGDWEYDYVIDAYTGEVLHREQERDD